MGNGDPNCQESDKAPKRSLFNGLAQVIVRARSAREIRIVARKKAGREPTDIGDAVDHNQARGGTGVGAGCAGELTALATN